MSPSSHHILGDLVLFIELLQVFLRTLLLRVGSQVSLNQVVHNVILSHTLDVNSTLDDVCVCV